MKKQPINFSWPATLSDFSTDTANENFSRGKLKVFYKGETADHRFFSDSFAEELVSSLPYTPVVSYYDEEKDDFVGHATEQQILGIVDPCRPYSFEEDEDGKSWCVCDVVLYTERPDKVGDLAKKIVGHSQSLELDPSSVKYNINYDEKKHFKNIEFTAGRFVGVSVLGNDQQPAFTGSSFFSYDEQFEAKMKTLRDYCESNQDQTQTGGNKMNLQEFMKLSWGDISSKVNDAIATEYGEEAFTYVIDMFEDSAIVQFYSYVEEKIMLLRIQYSVDDNGVITLGKANEVHITYEDVPEVKSPSEETGVTQATENSEIVEESVEDLAKKDPKEEEDKEPKEDSKPEEPKEEKENKEEPKEEEPKEEKPEEPKQPEEPKEEEEPKEDEEDKKKKKVADAACDENGGNADSIEEAAQVVNAEVTETEMKVSVDTDDETKETDSSSTSFTESERAEFEALKREKKVNLVNSYKEDLSEEDYNHFIGMVDEVSDEKLELELLKAYKASQSSNSKSMGVFAFAPIQESKSESALDAFVRKNIK